MKNLLIISLILSLCIGSYHAIGQTQSNIEEHNWKVVEIYADSVLMDNEPLFLRFSSGGTLMSDTLSLDPGSAQYQQRSISNNSYSIINSSTYMSSTQNTLEFVQDDETTLWDIIYEDLNTMILFKYDTIPATSISSELPYIYPLEMRLIKADL